MAEFSTNLFDLKYNVGDDRMKANYSYICGIKGVEGDELDIIGLRTTYLAKSRFASGVNVQLAISESQIKVTRPDSIFGVDCIKEVFGFQVNIKEKLVE
ncbi:hypothetical protein AVEN_184045-1 [Araneus ventricosus]|uniref:Uncharacterized protein n=1 Tax=Araneus ventricosus TaxID=182803 RepID=A0A4Y2QV27_ARAVE|nr:hypothetical protein AVEN_243164-1 [Araneus ventricosus]GBN67171.1 hypothetical protein AVEN_184045-1 [Araneus ventricosus]